MAVLVGGLLLFLWLIGIPAVAGSLFYNPYKKFGKVLYCLFAGQMLLWAVFFVLSLPMILIGVEFTVLVPSYLAAVALILITAAVVGGKRYLTVRGERCVHLVKESSGFGKFRSEKIFLYLAVLIVILQMVLTFALAYYDGDDAYYVAASTVTEESDMMYRKNVYTFGGSLIDYRRAMAPFPIWIAFLARVSGIRTVTVAHVAVSAAMILLADAIVFLIGGRLFRDGKKYVFFFFSQLLILYGDYSMYTPERFLIARSRQGKAALASLVIPGFFLVFFLLEEELREKKKVRLTWWVLWLCLQVTGLLCSTQGVAICVALTVILGICLAVSLRSRKVFFSFLATCIPALGIFLIYLVRSR